jgi:hypothetical protein
MFIGLLGVQIQCGGGSGGGGSPSGTEPLISSFAASADPVTVGSSTTLTAVFANGTGVIDQGVGSITSGMAAATGTISVDTTFTLTVAGANGTASVTRSVTVHAAPVPVTPTISAPSVVMSGGTGYTASAAPVVPGLEYDWSITGGTITAGARTPQITFSADAAGTLQLACSTVNNAKDGSSASQPASLPVLPAPSISTFQANPSTLAPGQSSTLAWSTSGADHLNILPDVGDVTGSTSVTVTPAASTTYTLTASNAAGAVTAQAMVTVGGQKPTITLFSASPTTVVAQKPCTLSWSVAGANVISLDNGIGNIHGDTSFTVNPEVATTYTLTATNVNGSVSASVTVNVTPRAPYIPSFTASPATINAGQSTILSWQAPWATSVNISPGIGIVTGNSVSVSPVISTIYTLTASNTAGTATAIVPVSVVGELPTIASFQADQPNIAPGNQDHLSWLVSGATSLSLDPGIGAITGNSIFISPLVSTTYTLTASNAAGSVSATLTITVTLPKPVIQLFEGTPFPLLQGQSGELNWSVNYADSLRIDPSPGAVTGNSLLVSPTITTTYTLTASNAVGSNSATYTITVIPAKPTIQSFSASQSTIAAGQSTTLSWTVDGATSLTIDQGVGMVTGSSLTVAPTVSTTYTLTATNSGGSSTVKATVLVNGSLPTITSFTASPATIAAGQATTLSWVASGATSFSINQGVGTATGTSVVVLPTAATTYTLSATNAYGTATATVTVGWVWGIFSATSGPTMGTAAVLLPNGRVFLAYGTGSAQLFDPATGTCTPTGAMTEANRQKGTATLLPNGLVLCAGGIDGNSNRLASAELFDPGTNTFSATGSMAVPQAGNTATLLPNGRVLITGVGTLTSTNGNAELYDPATKTFSVTGPMVENRQGGHCATLLHNGKVLITGGITDEAEAPSNHVEIYDPASGTFHSTSDMAIRRARHTSTLLPSGLVLVAGGQIGISGGVNNAELFDPATETFATPIDMTTWRISPVASLLPDGRVLVTGGQNNDRAPSLATAELYDPATGTFTQTGAMTTNRFVYTSTLLPDGRVLVTGDSSADLFDPQNPPPGP